MTLHPAITLSRSLGSGGSCIAYRVAQHLGWRYCDRAILRKAAANLGLDPVDLGPQEERPDRFMENLFCLMGASSPEVPFVPPVDLPVYSQALFEEESRIMARILEQEPAVLVGRGGFVAFRRRHATLHVHVRADADFRARRLVDSGRAADSKAALRLLQASDRNRAAFIRDIGGGEWQDPRNFDLVVDPGRDGFQACERQILEAAPREAEG